MKNHIIKNISLENVTVFEHLNYNPSSGINVVLGIPPVPR
jgi:hypothetical protein